MFQETTKAIKHGSMYTSRLFLETSECSEQQDPNHMKQKRKTLKNILPHLNCFKIQLTLQTAQQLKK